MKRSGFSAVLLPGMLLACGADAWTGPAAAQTPARTDAGCGADGYRVVARRWDAVLGRSWELRQNCAHPEWPTRSVAAGSVALGAAEWNGLVKVNEITQIIQPLLVHAGDRVRLWMQDEMVRIEMSGVVEQSARGGDRVMVQIMQHSDDVGMTVERIPGIVRSTGDVEMER